MSSAAPGCLTMWEQPPPGGQRRLAAGDLDDRTAGDCEGVNMSPMPEIVSAEKWQQDRDDLLKAEKEATRAQDVLAARRRRLPMVKFDSSKYVFDTPDGPKTLLDLFAGKPQLVVYQLLDNGPDAYCPGCTHFTNNVAGLGALSATEVSWVTVS